MRLRPGCELILAHGAGSTAEFLDRAFPVTATQIPTITYDDRTGSTEKVAAALARRLTPNTIVGGVSIGAHAAAKAASNSPVTPVGAVFVMPAWLGDPPPDSVTARSAALVAQYGPEAVLSQLASDPLLADDWVTSELGRAWPDRPSLAAELATAATEPAPTLGELAGLEIPCVVVALADDPVHPVAVARAWADALPQSVLVVLDRNEPAADRSVFAQAALTGWRQLSVSR